MYSKFSVYGIKCVSVCLCVCWAKTLSKFTSKSEMKFLCKLLQKFSPNSDKGRHRCQHRQVSRTHNSKIIIYLHAQFKRKGNFLLFWYCNSFFSLQNLCLADSYISPNISLGYNLAYSYVSP